MNTPGPQQTFSDELPRPLAFAPESQAASRKRYDHDGNAPWRDEWTSPSTYAIRLTNPEAPPCTGTLQAVVLVVPNPTLTNETAMTGTVPMMPLGTYPVTVTIPEGCPDNMNHYTMTATIPTNTMAVAPYVVRVTNSDELT